MDDTHSVSNPNMNFWTGQLNPDACIYYVKSISDTDSESGTDDDTTNTNCDSNNTHISPVNVESTDNNVPHTPNVTVDNHKLTNNNDIHSCNNTPNLIPSISSLRDYLVTYSPVLPWICIHLSMKYNTRPLRTLQAPVGVFHAVTSSIMAIRYIKNARIGSPDEFLTHVGGKYIIVSSMCHFLNDMMLYKLKPLYTFHHSLIIFSSLVILYTNTGCLLLNGLLVGEVSNIFVSLMGLVKNRTKLTTLVRILFLITFIGSRCVWYTYLAKKLMCTSNQTRHKRLAQSMFLPAYILNMYWTISILRKRIHTIRS
jgi:hypothetical protein